MGKVNTQVTRLMTSGAGALMAYALVAKSAHLSAEWWLWWGVMVACAIVFIATTGASDGTQQEADKVERDGNNADKGAGNVLHDHRASRRIGA